MWDKCICFGSHRNRMRITTDNESYILFVSENAHAHSFCKLFLLYYTVLQLILYTWESKPHKKEYLFLTEEKKLSLPNLVKA